MEDKQMICDLLCKALKATRAGANILELVYEYSTETVIVFFREIDMPTRRINVACDSGIAMIRDILQYIDIG